MSSRNRRSDDAAFKTRVALEALGYNYPMEVYKGSVNLADAA